MSAVCVYELRSELRPLVASFRRHSVIQGNWNEDKFERAHKRQNLSHFFVIATRMSSGHGQRPRIGLCSVSGSQNWIGQIWQQILCTVSPYDPFRRIQGTDSVI